MLSAQPVRRVFIPKPDGRQRPLGIPWKCRRLVIGTGAYGSLPVMKQVTLEAERRKIELLMLQTVQAIKALNESAEEKNAILHVIC